MKTKVLLMGFAASLLMLVPAIANQTKPRPVESFTVVGTEPFWNVEINQSGITYGTPEPKKVVFPYVAPLNAEGRPADSVRVYRLKGMTSGTLVIRKGACSDGMSDRKYDHSATMILGDTVKEGCAIKK
ncbi:COG3650 family protein [Leptolyngbya sp. NIES-2104]|uniref:COG3650 family protein n=1 Tax=Leptolyngbya sp. NIES-2104 TaxID=1552121 RepID=UPI0006EC624E|nr:hypothetical protein [Leptolyngbya sp. NIES-2104]GAP93629.1 hypothetical protein NIES2104_01360 [Leptolyngbya sp. NIES-2104]